MTAEEPIAFEVHWVATESNTPAVCDICGRLTRRDTIKGRYYFVGRLDPAAFAGVICDDCIYEPGELDLTLNDLLRFRAFDLRLEADRCDRMAKASWTLPTYSRKVVEKWEAAGWDAAAEQAMDAAHEKALAEQDSAVPE